MITLSSARIGSSTAGGSVASTSSAAPSISPDRSACARASCCTTGPRERFSRYAVGRIAASSDAADQAAGRIVEGAVQRDVVRARRAARPGRPVGSASRRRRSRRGRGRAPSSPRDCALRATSRPMAPRPTIPSVWPASRRGGSDRRSRDAPTPLVHVTVQMEAAAVEVDQEADGLRADLVDAEVRHVGHRDAGRRGGIEVHHVDADAIARDDLAPIRRWRSGPGRSRRTAPARRPPLQSSPPGHAPATPRPPPGRCRGLMRRRPRTRSHDPGSVKSVITTRQAGITNLQRWHCESGTSGPAYSGRRATCGIVDSVPTGPQDSTSYSHWEAFMPDLPALFDLSGRVAVVTGGGGALGRVAASRPGRGRRVGGRRRPAPGERGQASRPPDRGGRRRGHRAGRRPEQRGSGRERVFARSTEPSAGSTSWSTRSRRRWIAMPRRSSRCRPGTP